ncbi:MAG: exodeoxyribonuclease VII small subunit [Bacteroidales bacterium]|jgi:exodeoxyribonuclease VII small subunit|nr:exodeoxyribonuclease VII small subunit [Bacteroidales bacterium]
MSKKDFSYSEALKELEEILAEIETDEPDLDALTIKVKRATFLIKECKTRLRKTSEEIDSILSDWEKDE